MSTDFDATDWISQAEAARIRKVSRQAISKLVRGKRLRTIKIGGHLLVHRDDVSNYRPKKAGRPKRHD